MLSRQERASRDPSHLWASNKSAFCIIHQKDGAFVAQRLPSRNPSEEEQSRKPQSRRVVIAKDVVAGLIHNDNLLLCLEAGLFGQRRLSSYKVNLGRSGTWELAEHSHFRRKLSRDIDTSVGMCIQKSGELVELVLYSTEKKILRYTLSKR